MVFSHIECYLECNGLYPDRTSVFRRGRCATDNILDEGTTVQQQNALHRLCGVVFLDIKGAFNNLQHDAIMTATAASGSGEPVFGWISSDLTEWTIFFSREDDYINYYLVTQDAPQGGVLSSALLSIIENL